MQIFAPHAKDFYKSSHVPQYPNGLTKGYANFTPRSGNYRTVPGDKVVFVGLQLFTLDYLINDWNQTFFNKPKAKVCKKYARRISNGLGYKVNIKHMEALHDLGYLPLLIKALPEGSCISYKIPPFTIQSTNDDFGWLPNMIESVLSAEIWPVMTTATTYNEFRKLFELYAHKTGADMEFTKIQGHDFSFRGMMGRHAAALSGFGHLAAGGYGTDTIPAIDIAEEFYLADSDKEIVACSVPATEHSCQTASILSMNNEDFEYYSDLFYKL